MTGSYIKLMKGTPILTGRQAAAIGLAAVLAFFGCGKPQPELPPAPPSEAEQPPSQTHPAATAAATNGALTGAAAFQSRALASPFAQAELALKESFNRALIAFQIGDYARAVSELRDLAQLPDLTAGQKQAVQELLSETLKAAPELALTNSVVTSTGVPSVVPVATSPDAGSSNPFLTADPAIKDSFARAKAAYDIGNYQSALVELRDLAANAQLNWQQKYAVQTLLDKTPQSK